MASRGKPAHERGGGEVDEWERLNVLVSDDDTEDATCDWRRLPR
jgi:hypothetical protein